MDISSQLNSSTEAFFQELEKNKKALQDSWAYITETLNTALLQQDAEALLSLIPYMEQGDGTLSYAHIGESRRKDSAHHSLRAYLQKNAFLPAMYR